MDVDDPMIKMFLKRLSCSSADAEMYYAQAVRDAAKFHLEVSTAARAIADRLLALPYKVQALPKSTLYAPCPECGGIIIEGAARCDFCGKILNHYIRPGFDKEHAIQMVKDGYCPFNDCPYLDIPVSCMSCMECIQTYLKEKGRDRQ